MKEEIKQEEIQPISKVILIFILIVSILSLINSLDIIRKGSAFFKIGEPLIYEIIYINDWIRYIVEKLNNFYCLIVLFALYGVSIKKKSSFLIFILLIVLSQVQKEIVFNAFGINSAFNSRFLIAVIVEAIIYIIIYLLVGNIFRTPFFIFYVIQKIFNIGIPPFFYITIRMQNIEFFSLLNSIEKSQFLSFILSYKVSLILVICGIIFTLIKNKRVDEEGER